MAPKRRACLGLPESEDIDGIVIDDSDDGEAADLAAGFPMLILLLAPSKGHR